MGRAPPVRHRWDQARVVGAVRKTSAIGGYSRGLIHRAPRGEGGSGQAPGMSSFEPVSLLRLCKIAHSDRHKIAHYDPRLIPARTDACPHVTEIIGASPQPRNFWKQPDEKGDGAKPEATAAGGHPQNMVLAVANRSKADVVRLPSQDGNASRPPSWRASSPLPFCCLV